MMVIQDFAVLVFTEMSFEHTLWKTLWQKSWQADLDFQQPAGLITRYQQFDSCSWSLFKTFVRCRLMFYSHTFCGQMLCLNNTTMQKKSQLLTVSVCSYVEFSSLWTYNKVTSYFQPLCVCVCTGFCYLFRTFSGINTDRVRTNSSHGDQRPVLVWHNLISEVLVKFRGKV